MIGIILKMRMKINLFPSEKNLKISSKASILIAFSYANNCYSHFFLGNHFTSYERFFKFFKLTLCSVFPLNKR